ncbi:MAG TPA: helix-turn-helix transcriptional regulator [Kofleriaceae bacterium]|nr:helix-turn-helix transcriptional regulator [Kofleriaceae bacterium]
MAKRQARSFDDDGPYDKSINLQLRDHARYAGLTIEQVAVALGWHPKKVYRLFTGETRLLVNHLFAFAKIIGIPPAYLLLPPPSQERVA